MTDHAPANPSIVLCPGQGAQHVGMGKAWVKAHPTAADVFARADALLDFDIRAMCFDGPEDRLGRTDVAQAAIYVTSVACFEALKASGAVGAVAAAAGLSLGEFTALHIAGAIDFATGLRLVRLRGQAMQEAAEAAPSGMVALVGADEAQAQELCDEARGGGVLVPANFNCPGQVVVSGSGDACERALAAAEKRGLRATPLTVAGAFHSPLMAPAAQRLAEALEQADWHRPAAPVLSNVTAQPHDGDDVDSIKARLVQQLTSPVRWGQSMQWLIDQRTGNGSASFVELAPGKVLSGLMRRIDRKTKVQNYGEPA